MGRNCRQHGLGNGPSLVVESSMGTSTIRDIWGLFDPEQVSLVFLGDAYLLKPIYEDICALSERMLERMAVGQ